MKEKGEKKNVIKSSLKRKKKMESEGKVNKKDEEGIQKR